MLHVIFAVIMFVCVMASQAMAGTAQITYTEPNANVAGNPLTNLKETTIYWKQDGGAEQTVKVPASAPTGGGSISKVITIADPPLCGSTSVAVQASASNTNTTGFESARTAVVTGTKSNIPPTCALPNAPFNLTVTLP